jgi:predicted  nucleic acid-binding Zn-ribbon protein
MPEDAHPVREIVLPLAVVLGLVANGILVGVAWGKLSTVVTVINENQTKQSDQLKELTVRVQGIGDRLHDVERDAEQDRRDFRTLEDYTRGRVDRLQYRAPAASRK